MAVFADQNFVITGATGGIGQAVASAVSRKGAGVCLCGRDSDRLHELSERLQPNKCRIYQSDLTSAESLEQTVRQIRTDHARIHGLIHCAATIELGAVANASGDSFERQFRLNVLAPFKLTQLLLPQLVENGAQIVFINSSAGLNARPNAAQYSATKHALKAVADSLRLEINSAGVRVCSLFIGDTATPMQDRLRKEQGRPYQPERLIQPEDVADMVIAVLSLARTAEVTDLIMRPLQKT